MGSIYYFLCACLNFILSLLGEPTIDPHKKRTFEDSSTTHNFKKKFTNPLFKFPTTVRKKLAVDNIYFYTNLLNLENAFINYKNILFIGCHKLYNKGRYSRNKQIYRTGVIWCLWLTVVALAAPFFYFYSFTFNFTYLWIFFFIFIIKLLFNYTVKHNYINSWKIFDFFSNLLKN